MQKGSTLVGWSLNQAQWRWHGWISPALGCAGSASQCRTDRHPCQHEPSNTNSRRSLSAFESADNITISAPFNTSEAKAFTSFSSACRADVLWEASASRQIVCSDLCLAFMEIVWQSSGTPARRRTRQDKFIKFILQNNRGLTVVYLVVSAVRARRDVTTPKGSMAPRRLRIRPG